MGPTCLWWILECMLKDDDKLSNTPGNSFVGGVHSNDLTLLPELCLLIWEATNKEKVRCLPDMLNIGSTVLYLVVWDVFKLHGYSGALMSTGDLVLQDGKLTFKTASKRELKGSMTIHECSQTIDISQRGMKLWEGGRTLLLKPPLQELACSELSCRIVLRQSPEGSWVLTKGKGVSWGIV